MASRGSLPHSDSFSSTDPSKVGSEKPDHLVIIFYFRFYFYFELGFCYFSGERVRTTKIRMLKVKKYIKNLKRIRTLKVSIKRIRTSKDQNDNNYLWHSTYGYQGLWGVRLGSFRLGLVRIG